MAVSCVDRPLEALHPSRSLVKSVIEFTMQRLLSTARALRPLSLRGLVYRDCARVAIISTLEYNYLGYWNSSVTVQYICIAVRSLARLRSKPARSTRETRGLLISCTPDVTARNCKMERACRYDYPESSFSNSIGRSNRRSWLATARYAFHTVVGGHRGVTRTAFV